MKDSYEAVLEDVFQSEAGEIDPEAGDVEAAEEINEWVRNKTNGRIDKLFGEWPEGGLLED